MSYEPKTVAEINAYNGLFYERPQAVGIIMENDRGQKRHPNEILLYAIISLQERVEAGWDGEGLGKTGYTDYDNLIRDKQRQEREHYSNQQIARALFKLGHNSIVENHGVNEENSALIDAISKVLKAIQQATEAHIDLKPVVAVDEERVERRPRVRMFGPSF